MKFFYPRFSSERGCFGKILRCFRKSFIFLLTKAIGGTLKNYWGNTLETKTSKLWYVFLVYCLLMLVGVAYAKIASVRAVVDAKCPWIQEQLANYHISLPKLPGDGTAATASPEPTPTDAQDASGDVQPLVGSTAPGTASSPLPANTMPSATPVPSPAHLSFAQIVADKSLWPKKVHLKKDTIFPAVMNRKKVGELHVAAGTEVMLIQVRSDKLGVAYTPTGSMDNAGGAMVVPDDTDLVEQANLARH